MKSVQTGNQDYFHTRFSFSFELSKLLCEIFSIDPLQRPTSADLLLEFKSVPTLFHCPFSQSGGSVNLPVQFKLISTSSKPKKTIKNHFHKVGKSKEDGKFKFCRTNVNSTFFSTNVSSASL